MTCTCKAELIAAINAVSDDYTFKAGAGLRTALNRIVAELTSPAPAEPQEPLTGWRAKCHVKTYTTGTYPWYVTYDDGTYQLGIDAKWYRGRGDCSPYFPTASAARAALLAASEPGKAEPARGPCTCNRNHVDDDEHAPDCGKPAPAVAFDPEKWAEKMVRPIIAGGLAGLHELNGSGGYCAFYQDHNSNEARICHARQIIAAALRAAESAGYARAKAEQTPNETVWRTTGRYCCNCGKLLTQHRDQRYCPQPAAPAAAKEPPHAD